MRKNPAIIILAIFFGLNTIALIAVYDLSQPRFLQVTFFDVGQGDAIFIETPKRHQILIDGGPDSGILEKLAKEMPFWDNTLDLMILTHPEKDHVSGLIEVLKRYKVENILWTGVIRDTSEYKAWLEAVRDEKAEVKIARSGQRILWESNSPDFIDILYPLENLAGREFKDSNNTSVVARLVFGEQSFLFTGDAHKSVERELAEKEVSIDSDVLKVGHHGSKTSSSQEFIEKVSPEIAVISAAKNNSYGHPHQEVLDILKKYGIKILRTDESGDIKIFSDGRDITIK